MYIGEYTCTYDITGKMLVDTTKIIGLFCKRAL